MSDLDASTEGVPIPSPSNAGTQINLQVGEQRFITTIETLTGESPFFSALLSGCWNAVKADGCYFIDADPSVFKHILCYLRHGVLPIFYSNSNGHDHALYIALWVQAKYFQVTRLEKWLGDRKYLHAVQVIRSGVDVEGANSIAEMTGTDMEIEYHPAWKTERTYICPRGIDLHRGNPSACGRLCRRAQGDAEDEFVEVQVLRTLMVRKRTVIKREEVFLAS